MVDAGALSLKSGIAVCSANAPRQLPTDHAVEAGEAGPSGFSQIPRWESSPTITMDAMSHSTIVNPVTVFHDRTRPLTNNSGHCLETHTGSHLDVNETDSPDSTTVISHLTTANSSTAFHDSTRPPSKTSGHCFETDAGSQLEDADTATSSTMVTNSNTLNPPFLIRPCRKVQTYRERMNRLHQLKNQYPVDLFNSFVARLRSANAHLFDERSSEGHD
jgi:hypothetical protein